MSPLGVQVPLLRRRISDAYSRAQLSFGTIASKRQARPHLAAPLCARSSLGEHMWG